MMSATIIPLKTATPPLTDIVLPTYDGRPSRISALHGVTECDFIEGGPFGGARQWSLDRPDADGMQRLSYLVDGEEHVIVCHQSALPHLRRMLAFSQAAQNQGAV